MNTNVKEKWVKALRSGEYKQGTKRLRNKFNEYYCLGVLCDLHRKENDNDWEVHENSCYRYIHSTALLPQQVGNWAWLEYRHEGPLVALNDGGKSFEEIANYIEENL